MNVKPAETDSRMLTRAVVKEYTNEVGDLRIHAMVLDRDGRESNEPIVFLAANARKPVIVGDTIGLVEFKESASLPLPGDALAFRRDAPSLWALGIPTVIIEAQLIGVTLPESFWLGNSRSKTRTLRTK